MLAPPPPPSCPLRPSQYAFRHPRPRFLVHLGLSSASRYLFLWLCHDQVQQRLLPLLERV